MVSLLYAVLDIVCLIILAFLGLQNEKYKNMGPKQRYIRFIITEVTIYCFIDMLWGIWAVLPFKNPKILFTITTLYFLITGFIATSWVRFVMFYIGRKSVIPKRLLLTICYYIPFIVEVVMLALNIKTESLFYITPEGEYFRSPTHYLYIVFDLQFVYYLAAIIISLLENFRQRKSNVNIRTAVHCFSLIPLIFIILQLFFPYMPLYATGLMLAVFDIFIFDVIDEREIASNRTLLMQQKQIFEKCNKILNQSNSVQKNIDSLLQLVLSYYNADRIFILELRDTDNAFFDCKYEFCKPGVTRKMKDMKDIRVNWFLPFFGFVQGKDFFAFDDLSVFGNNEETNKILTMFGVSSGIVAPIRFAGNARGFIGIDNPKVRDDDLTVLRTSIVFIYSELLRRFQIETEQKTNGAVLLALAAEYSSVYYIDVKTGLLRPYRYNSQIKRLYGDYYKDKITYKAAYEMWLQDLVADQSKEDMKPYGDIEFVCKKLKNRKNLKKQFVCTLNGHEEYFQTKWVKVEEDENSPTAFVLGVANVDDQVRSKELLHEQQKELEKKQEELVSVKEKAEDAERISQQDRLTELYNKISGQTLIQDYLKAKRDGEKFALIFIDIDKFKDFNDKFGHLVGDEILMEVGRTIKVNCRQNDIPIRFGGDEFVILLKNQVDEKPAMRKVEKIRKELETLSIGKEWNLTCSIGIYLGCTSNFDEAVERADDALYDVKDSGRNDVKVIAG